VCSHVSLSGKVETKNFALIPDIPENPGC